MADTQKSERTCLPRCSHQDSFVQGPDGRDLLEFLYTEEDARRNIQDYVTTLLGSLRCRMDIQLVYGKAMLLKCVSSYVTKMHQTATSEGLYCCDITGHQAANSFLRTVCPLAPEMIFQLTSIKVVWTDKLTKQFCVPHPGQEGENVVYQLYVRGYRGEEHLPLLQWLSNHTTTTNKAKSLAKGKYLVSVKFVSVFNPAFFFQHLLMIAIRRIFATARSLLCLSASATFPKLLFFVQTSGPRVPRLPVSSSTRPITKASSLPLLPTSWRYMTSCTSGGYGWLIKTSAPWFWL